MLSPTVIRPVYKQDFSLTETGGKLKRGKIIKILNEGWWQYWQAKVASKKEESEHEGDETPPEKPVREVHRGPLGCYLRTPWKLFRNHFGTTSVALGDYFWITLRATSWLLGGESMKAYLKSQSGIPNKWMVQKFFKSFQFTLRTRSGSPHLIKFCCVVVCSLWN